MQTKAKAKDLRYPFSWEERKPAIHQGVLFVPKYFGHHHEWNFPGWEDPAVFGKQSRVFIEYCSGNGAWIFTRAQKQPLDHWVAVEQKFDRASKIWAKRQNSALSNLFVVLGEALTFTSCYISKRSVDGVFINFPDPWPKLKHAKNRLLQAPFVKELSRVIKIGGEVVLVTDDAPYALQMQKEMMAHPAFKPLFPEPYYATEWPEYGSSYFDSLWRGKGKTIHYLRFVNCECS
jgi:tRNA (guanine-N7-)-methyltransferase